MNTTVTPNARLTGEISRKSRQIDVLIEGRWENLASTRMIIDAKHRVRKIDVNDVESFEGLMKDLGVNRGIIVCISGYTDGARNRAQEAITITLLTLKEAEEFYWALEPCLGNCSFDSSENRKRGMVLWGEFLPEDIHGMWAIIRTGKCDGCHSFHVWCWDCGEKFVVEDKEIFRCNCEREWASVPESPESGHIGPPESVWLMMREDENPIPLDRKPII